jgi:hypothetical protein
VSHSLDAFLADASSEAASPTYAPAPRLSSVRPLDRHDPADHHDAVDGLPELEGVALVRWPADADHRERLADDQRPRLLLIEPDAPPPVCWDDLEDWARLPVDPLELEARISNLRQRTPTAVPVPILDSDGLLRAGDRWVALPRIEARLVARMLHQPGQVVPRAELLAAGWPHRVPDDVVLASRIRSLRRRIGEVGLAVRTVRGVGYLVEPTA